MKHANYTGAVHARVISSGLSLADRRRKRSLKDVSGRGRIATHTVLTMHMQGAAHVPTDQVCFGHVFFLFTFPFGISALRRGFWLSSPGHLFFPLNHLQGYPNDGLTGVEVLPIVLTGSLKLKPQAIHEEP